MPYTRVYDGERQSSRVKDLVDLVLIQAAASLSAARLRDALHQTFTGRDAHEMPAALPPPPESWGTPFRRMALEVSLALDLDAAFTLAGQFLDPILSGVAPDDARWNSATGAWAVPDDTAPGVPDEN